MNRDDIKEKIIELLGQFHEGQIDLLDNPQFISALMIQDTKKMLEAAGDNTTDQYAEKILLVVGL